MLWLLPIMPCLHFCAHMRVHRGKRGCVCVALWREPEVFFCSGINVKNFSLTTAIELRVDEKTANGIARIPEPTASRCLEMPLFRFCEIPFFCFAAECGLVYSFSDRGEQVAGACHTLHACASTAPCTNRPMRTY